MSVHELGPRNVKDVEKGLNVPLLNRHDRRSLRGKVNSDDAALIFGRIHQAPIRFPVRLFVLGFAIGCAWTTLLWRRYPYGTTIPIFVGAAFIVSSWVALSWYHVLRTAWALNAPQHRVALALTMPRKAHRYTFAMATILASWWLVLILSPTPQYPLPDLSKKTDKYFIAAILYNNEAILPNWMEQMELLAGHLGPENVYISIYESNSHDATPVMLQTFGHSLAEKGIRNRCLVFDHDGRNWGTHQRIPYLARVRNIVLEPISSADASVRLPDWQSFTKVIYLNDIVYKWQDIVRLIGTQVEGQGREDYDMVCAVDQSHGGLYDAWVARDICGTALRTLWPYTNDPATINAIRSGKPFEVATCWNGAVVMNAGPFLYSSSPRPMLGSRSASTDASTAMPAPRLRSRGVRIGSGDGETPVWQMIDNASHPDSAQSPALTLPLQFRTSGIDGCVHSECFLLPYDLHRLGAAQGRRPRIWMNPSVNVAYEPEVYHFNNVVLRMPIIKWW